MFKRAGQRCTTDVNKVSLADIIEQICQATGLQAIGLTVGPDTFGFPLLNLTISQVAPILPYLFLVLILIFRPKGLLGTRSD